MPEQTYDGTNVADDAGALLVRSGLVTSSALDGARARAVEVGGTIGEQLVADGTVTDELLTDFYKSRLLVPQVNPNILARLPAKLVAVIPTDMAIELRVIPVSLDPDDNLTVAMSDPSDRHAVDEISFFTGAYVVRAVATQMQIAWCLAHYYGHITALGQRLLTPEAAATPVSAPRTRPRGITAEVDAMRHRGLVPGETPVAATSGEIKQPRPRSISGEIRQPRAQSVKPPMPDDSGPVITMEADDTSGEGGPPISESPALARTRTPPGADDTQRATRPAPKRKRPAEPDPPELAARAGEVDLKSGADREIASGPSIVIDDELERDGEAAPPGGGADWIAQREQSGEINIAGLRDVSGEIRLARRDPATSRADIAVSQSEDDSAPVMIHESLRPARIEDAPSAPILLERKRPGDPSPSAPPPAHEDDDGEIVELAAKKTIPIAIVAQAPVAVMPSKREHRRTEVGLGVVGIPASRAHRDTVEGVPAQLEDDPTGEHTLAAAIDRAIDSDPTRVEMLIAPAEDDPSSDEIAAPPAPFHDQDTSPIAAPPNTLGATPVPPPSGRVELSNVQRAPSSHDDDDEPEPGDVRGGKPTIVMQAVQAPVEDDDDTETWGAPGTTIPPPFLGAIPGIVEQRFGLIPIADVDSAPLMVAPPSPPEHRAHTNTEAGIARALEQATVRVLDLIRDLGTAADRDEVVAVMIAHLAENHRRAGFFAVRSSELSLFSVTPNVVPLPVATVRLDRPSTLADIVGTRLPYRGPMHDVTSRMFLQAILGVCPPEILLVPITVRERVVGVLFGEHRMRHTFDDQLALASRAAGDALERILKAKRS
ncbi:hypothetical protein BH11MYX1_BH11MYX1_43590 [soil metagenome]